MKPINAAEFIEENLKTIFAYTLSRVSNKEDAEDLTNDIVLAILQSSDKLRNQNAFYGYIWRIAANTYGKFLRRKKLLSFDEIDDEPSDESDFTEELSAREDILKLRQEIALLSKEYRECAIAYYYDELSCAEVSKKLNISIEMVKYYLFKTRKILKEGICMEREFGEKSFNPAPFEFVTIFSGNFNREYQNLFRRKLPGQILLSAYYTPMTIRELAIELGTASVYLEDEAAILEQYGFLSKTSAGKYQTNLLIFTEDFTKEFYNQAKKFTVPSLAELILSAKGKLAQVRRLNDFCGKLSDTRLLWGLLWAVMRRGDEQFRKAHPEFSEKNVPCGGTGRTNYGISGEKTDDKFDCSSFAGYAEIDENYHASAADFKVLPKTNRYFGHADNDLWKEKIYRTVSGEMPPEFIILTKAEERMLYDILGDEASMMAALYERLFSCACRLMHTHAPKNVDTQIDGIMFQTLFFRTVGFIGGCAVESGSLALPDFEGPAAIYICENK